MYIFQNIFVDSFHSRAKTSRHHFNYLNFRYGSELNFIKNDFRLPLIFQVEMMFSQNFFLTLVHMQTFYLLSSMYSLIYELTSNVMLMNIFTFARMLVSLFYFFIFFVKCLPVCLSNEFQGKRENKNL